MSRLSRVLLGIVIAAGLVVVGSGGYIAYRLYMADGQTAGMAAIGGPFRLVNTEGETVTEKDLAGRYTLVFFGFTNCPDVCPTGLWRMSQALELLEEEAPGKANAVTPVFITVDPERDTVEVVRDYLDNFHPRFVGLTGSPEQIAQATGAYRVYAEKAEETQDSHDHSHYLVNHSSYIYLMDPEGRYITHFTHKTGPEEMAGVLRDRVQS